MRRLLKLQMEIDDAAGKQAGDSNEEERHSERSLFILTTVPRLFVFSVILHVILFYFILFPYLHIPSRGISKSSCLRRESSL